MQRDDSLWKAILEDVFDDFLRFSFPNADELFYLDKGFEYLDKELEQPLGRPRIPTRTG
ncbi:hypothetical protein [Spirosoma daeguense]